MNQKDSFSRTRRRRDNRPLSTKEKTVFVLSCLQVLLAIWAVALVHLETQLLFFALSLIGFIVAISPQQKNLLFQHAEPNTAAAWQRLKRFPIFWAGIGLFIYILMQALNPAYRFELLGTGTHWKILPTNHVSWLPSSINSPFSQMNPWRLMMILGSAWLFLCYNWMGLVRRRLLIGLLWVVFVSGIAFCALTLIQKQLGASKIFWSFEAYPNLFGSVPYKNRGAASLYLMMGCSMALYFYLLRDMRKRLRKSGPHLVVLIGIIIQYGTLWTSFSRGGIAAGSVVFGAFCLLVLIDNLREGNSLFLKIAGVTAFISVAVGSIFAIPKLPDFEKTIKQFGRTEAQVESGSFSGRGPATKVTIDMIRYKTLYGWGAGSWRFVFPHYQVHYPDLIYKGHGEKRKFAIWHDAHNDWAQYFSEVGAIGALFLLTAVIWPLAHFILRLGRARATHWILAITFSGVILHGLIELLFQNMAVLCLTGVVVLLLGRMAYNGSKSTEA